MAETTSGEASIDPAGIDIRAITTNDSRWPDAASRLAKNLLPAMHFNPQVAEISRAGPLAASMSRIIPDGDARQEDIEFAISSAELRSSSAPMLDELVQIATDCPDGRIEITGHTDSSGNETGNLALSQSRADAVAAYFARRPALNRID